MEDPVMIGMAEVARDWGHHAVVGLGTVRGMAFRIRSIEATLMFVPEGWTDRCLVWAPVEGYYGGAYGWMLSNGIMRPSH
jgi:hypothetical protein